MFVLLQEARSPPDPPWIKSHFMNYIKEKSIQFTPAILHQDRINFFTKKILLYSITLINVYAKHGRLVGRRTLAHQV